MRLPRKNAVRLRELFSVEKLYELFQKLCRIDVTFLGRLYRWGFHRFWYYSRAWTKMKWFGTEILQNPMDLFVLQEIIYGTKPEFIIETGTYKGGTSLFFAHMLDLLGRGSVITIDVHSEKIPDHPRIIRIVGNSTARDTEMRVKEIVGEAPCMVFLDSAHNKQHVLAEFEIYSKFVGIGCYLVVADTNVNGHPVLPLYAMRYDGKVTYGGPMEAVKEFLKKHQEFVIDKSREKLYFTFFTSGFLRKVTKLEK